jgi:predicted DNA-binding transcriptional regulator AlpA
MGRLHLVGAHEIRLRLGGISRQRVYQLTSRPDFPPPVADLAQGKVWQAGDVDAWIAARQTRNVTAPSGRRGGTGPRGGWEGAG